MMIRNGIALPPSLNRGMVLVAEGSGERTDAAPRSDELLMAGHVRLVRCERTSVNGVESVRRKFDIDGMTIPPTTGDILCEMRRRADLTLDEIATLAGYRGKSSVQEYFKPTFARKLSIKAAEALAKALVGRGDPAIRPEEFVQLTLDTVLSSGDLEQSMLNGVIQKFEGASEERMLHVIPVYGTALGADKIVEGAAIEQTSLNTGDVMTYVKRPVILDGRADVYGIYVQGSSMDPAFEDGSLILVEGKRPPRIGENVVVYLRQNGEEDGDDRDNGEAARMVMVKKLVRRSGSFIELMQHNPSMTFTVKAVDVLKMHRVIPWGELLS